MSNTKLLFAVGSALLIGLAVGYLLSGTEAAASVVKWTFGDAELAIDLKKDLASDETLLQKVFSKKFSATGAEGWLKDTRGLYPYDDTDLVTRQATLGYDHPAARALRELRLWWVGPWAHQSQKVRVSIPPEEYQPTQGQANVCASGIFFRKQVEVFLPDNPDQRIILKASGRYSCPQGFSVPDIQLNRDDALRLFGYNNFGKYEEAAVVLVQE